MLSIALCALLQPVAPQADSNRQLWQAHLDVALPEEEQAADLTFGLELVKGSTGWSAFLINEPERIPVPRVEWDGQRLLLSIDHYDSRIEAELNQEGVLHGTWEKVRGKDKLARVPFWATRGAPEKKPTRAVLARNVAGRWAVDFSSDEHGAVGLFEQKGAALQGTFLTATGDYRFLAGHVEGKRMRLSCFDGAHAFLFEAEIGEDDTLSGSFHSGNWWKETWTARRDAEVEMTDGFAQTTWDESTSLAELNFLDQAGELRSLAEPGFLGQATIIQLFGTWCPNCHDETRFLVELHRRYASRGLRVVGLAFELEGEFERDSGQLEVFRKRHDVPYPLLLAGTANKKEASLAFPAIDRLRSYPTTIFIDSTGRVRGLHSGFAGPATGEEHHALREHYERWLESLLSEEPAPMAGAAARLDGSSWQQPGGVMSVTFKINEAGQLQALHTPVDALGEPQHAERNGPRITSPVTIRGDALWFGGLPWRLDEEVGSLAQTQRVGMRLFELGAPARMIPRQLGGVAEVELAHIAEGRGIAHDQPKLRQEALYLLARHVALQPSSIQQIIASMQDEAHSVRRVALWAAGQAKLKDAQPALVKHLRHPNASERREAVSALIKLGAIPRAVSSKWPDLWSMADPIVGELLRPYPRPKR